MATQKDKALEFLKRVVKGDCREAFRLFISPGFKHHNAFFKGDGHSLMTAMEEAAKTNPGKILEIQRAIEEGDLVAVHSRLIQDPEDQGMAVMHIFRFNEGKIAELWDFAQAVPAELVNENGMF